jgi:hypothetical protein
LENILHTVNVNWREAQATTLEMKEAAVNEWLEHTEDLVKMFEDDKTVSSELRGVAGTLRSRRNDFDTAANKLRAEINDRNGREM